MTIKKFIPLFLTVCLLSHALQLPAQTTALPPFQMSYQPGQVIRFNKLPWRLQKQYIWSRFCDALCFAGSLLLALYLIRPEVALLFIGYTLCRTISQVYTLVQLSHYKETFYDQYLQDPLAQTYAPMFAVLDFSILPQRRHKAHPLAAYIKAFIVMIDQKITNVEDLRRFLLLRPELVYFLGFQPQGVHPLLPFSPEQTLPTTRHLRRVFSLIQNQHLQALLHATVAKLKALKLIDGNVCLDTTEILARVRQNNPKQFVTNRFAKDQIPSNVPDGRLGAKASTEKDADGKPKVRYFWGFKNGAAFQQTRFGLITLAEITRPAHVYDVKFFAPLFDTITTTLALPITKFFADAAFDAWYVYQKIYAQKGIPFIALNSRGYDLANRNLSPDGVPLCQDGRAMQFHSTYFDKSKNHHRTKFTCPLLEYRTGKKIATETCRCSHPNFQRKGCTRYLNADDKEQLRFTLDRTSDYFKSNYAYRTAAERGFSVLKAFPIEQPFFENQNAIANLWTLAHTLQNARVIVASQAAQAPSPTPSPAPPAPSLTK